MKPFTSVACSFQGGGALGAYQVGVLEALLEAGYKPNWFVGTSIGAINAAIAAGNAPKDIIDKLKTFWDTIATPISPFDFLSADDEHLKRLHHQFSARSSLLFGQPGFFTPRFPPPELNWHSDARTISFYDTSPLKSTLEKLVDFDRINHKKTRLSVGAVEVESGEMVYFDTKNTVIRPEHIMASGALPPSFPAVEIDGFLYWDGGISSNSPISYVLSDNTSKSVLCFMVHLFDSYGLQPKTLDDVLKRKKDIEFSSRFLKMIAVYQEIHALRYRVHQIGSHLPKAIKNKPELQDLLSCGCDKTIAMVRFLYESQTADLSSKDYEFSKSSITNHIISGYQDAYKSIQTSPWLHPIDKAQGIALYDMASSKNKEST